MFIFRMKEILKNLSFIEEFNLHSTNIIESINNLNQQLYSIKSIEHSQSFCERECNLFLIARLELLLTDSLEEFYFCINDLVKILNSLYSLTSPLSNTFNDDLMALTEHLEDIKKHYTEVLLNTKPEQIAIKALNKPIKLRKIGDEYEPYQAIQRLKQDLKLNV